MIQTFGGAYEDEARSLIRTADGLALTGILEYASGDAVRSAAWVVALQEAAAQPNVTPTTVGGGGTSAIDLIAVAGAFDRDTLTVPAGATVTVNFTNPDSGDAHNFAVYTDGTASEAIFQGDAITGPAWTTCTFTAPDRAGNYFFRCDIHPTAMTGTLVVEWGGRESGAFSASRGAGAGRLSTALFPRAPGTQNCTRGASDSRMLFSIVQKYASPWATRKMAMRAPSGPVRRRSLTQGRSR